jgi:MFS family permease
VLSLTGDMAAISALSIHIYQGTASGLAVSGLFVARVLPRLFGALGGAVGDRVDLRRLLISCELVSGLVLLVIAWSQPGYEVLLVMVLISESIATVAQPASQTLVARTVPADTLARANGMVMAVAAVSFAAGAAIGSAAATTWGYQIALYIDALSFALSAALVSMTRKVPPPARRDGAATRFLASTVAGLAELRRNRQVLMVAVAVIGVTFAAALDRPALVVVTQRDFASNSVAYGLALGGVSIGALLATLLMGRTRLLAPSAAVLVVGVSVEAAGHLGMGLAPVVAALVAAAFTAGFGNGIEGVSATTLLQRASAGELVGLLMGVVMSSTYLADAVGSVAGGALVGVLGAHWTFVTAAVLMGACALVVGMTARTAPPAVHGSTTEGVTR